MRVPLSWLRDFAPIDLPVDELVLLLGALGTPVESVTEVGGGLDGVVVARVEEIGPIPGADKIRVVQVDAGGDERVQVVCGAWNFEVGDLVPLATVGAVLPGDFKIARRKMKGVESHGMLCASDELGLPGGDHSGILLLPETLAPGADFSEAMGITADVVLELEVNPNRPDAMSIAGVARDLAAALGVTFTLPSPSVGSVAGTPASIEVDDLDGCPRFVGRVLTGVQVGPAPAWMASRLTLAGMRPINNVVDVSNYVMLELGHPNHAYDLAQLPGRGLRVRRAREGETLVTLDDVERRFTTQDLLICDAADTAVGIAGIMGGASSEVTDATTELLLEAAYFDPMSISWTSKRLALRSEASARFEKGVDALGIDLAVERFCQLLADLGGATPTDVSVDVRGDLDPAPPVRVRTARVNTMLGTSLADGDIVRLLDPIGFTTSAAGDGLLDVAIPSWRPDSATEIDVIEEVARMYGYARIVPTLPTSTVAGRLTDTQRDRRLVRTILTGVGVSEAWTTTFLAPSDIEQCGLDVADAVVVSNPLVVDESRLRPSLLPGLLRAVAYNESHRLSAAWLFELGNVFRVVDRASLPDERERLGVVLAGGEAPDGVDTWHVLAEGLKVLDHHLVAASPPGLHPTRSAEVVVDGETIGVVGEVDPAVLEELGITERVGWLDVDLLRLLEARRGPGQYSPVSRYPSSDVDLSFELDEGTPAGAVAAALGGAGVGVVGRVRLIDTYRGTGLAPGTRSVTFRIRLQAPDRTLTDEELATARQRLIDAVTTTLPAVLRG
jgi:phenylalanyl-tRNA synthetase beta chain